MEFAGLDPEKDDPIDSGLRGIPLSLNGQAPVEFL